MLHRHVNIQIAAVVTFAVTVVNVSFFVHKINHIWSIKVQSNEQIARGSNVCVLIPEDNSFVWDFTLPDMVNTIETDDGFVFNVFIGFDQHTNKSQNISLEHLNWFVKKFPRASKLRFVPVFSNESVFSTLFSSASQDGCRFYFVIDRHTRFVSRGWAGSLVSVLGNAVPLYLGAVNPSGCVNCLFVHEIHRELFATHSYPPDVCWAEWVRWIYSPNHLFNAHNVMVHSFSNRSCEADKPGNFSLMISRGRLYVNKFISLDLDSTRVNAGGASRA